jgi:hypothetical protein
MKMNKEGGPTKIVNWVIAIVVLTVAARIALPQSGGEFYIKKSVIAPGETVSGGSFTLQSAIGQPVSGNVSGGQFAIAGGFVEPALQPTAVAVAISGRVTTRDGYGIGNALVQITDSSGSSRIARTGSFGYFHFDEVAVGQTYIIEIASKRFSFASQSVTIYDEIQDLIFVAF